MKSSTLAFSGCFSYIWDFASRRLGDGVATFAKIRLVLHKVSLYKAQLVGWVGDIKIDQRRGCWDACLSQISSVFIPILLVKFYRSSVYITNSREQGVVYLQRISEYKHVQVLQAAVLAKLYNYNYASLIID